VSLNGRITLHARVIFNIHILSFENIFIVVVTGDLLGELDLPAKSKKLSQKIPPKVFRHFFPSGAEFSDQILLTY